MSYGQDGEYGGECNSCWKAGDIVPQEIVPLVWLKGWHCWIRDGRDSQIMIHDDDHEYVRQEYLSVGSNYVEYHVYEIKFKIVS